MFFVLATRKSELQCNYSVFVVPLRALSGSWARDHLRMSSCTGQLDVRLAQKLHSCNTVGLDIFASAHSTNSRPSPVAAAESVVDADIFAAEGRSVILE